MDYELRKVNYELWTMDYELKSRRAKESYNIGATADG